MSCFEHAKAKLLHGAIFQIVQRQVDARMLRRNDPATQVCGGMLLARARISVFVVRNVTLRAKSYQKLIMLSICEIGFDNIVPSESLW